MVVYSLKKNASQIRQQVANSLVDICKGSLDYDEELNIEGMVCITMDKQQVLPINFNIQLQKKPVRQDGSGDNAPSTSAGKEVPTLPSGLMFPPGTTISAPDLQSAQAALQSLLNKTAAEASSGAGGDGNTSQPEFISLSDMAQLEEVEEESEASKPKRVKLEELSEDEGNDIAMEEEMVEGQQETSRPPTLQDTVGNVIKSYYQEVVTTSSITADSGSRSITLTTAPHPAASTTSGGVTRVPAPLTVIKVVKTPSPGKQTSPRIGGKGLTPQQKLAAVLPWKNKDTVKKFQCPMCSYTSDRRFCINRHMKLHVGRAGVQCQICKNVFADHWYLTKVHMPKHHPQGNQIVGVSADGVSPQSSPAGGKDPITGNSVTLAPKETIIKCPVCPFSANSAISFRNHLNTHSRDCLRCGLRFLTPNDVQQHIHSVHGGEEDEENYMFDPDMVDQMEEEALRTAVRTTGTVPGALHQVSQVSEVTEAQSVEVSEAAAAAGGDLLVYNASHQQQEQQQSGNEGAGGEDQLEATEVTEDQVQEESGEQVESVEPPQLLLNQNYMMVVNEANQVEIHAADGTVVEGIVSEDGQVYTTSEVAIEGLAAAATAAVKKEFSNGAAEVETTPITSADT